MAMSNLVLISKEATTFCVIIAKGSFNAMWLIFVGEVAVTEGQDGEGLGALGCLAVIVGREPLIFLEEHLKYSLDYISTDIPWIIRASNNGMA